MRSGLFQRLHSLDRLNLLGGLSGVLVAAVAMGLVSIFTFRVADGVTLLLSTTAACAIVYCLSATRENWH